MLHGVLASESTYRSIMKRPDFVPNREAIAVDLRNHGQSPHVPIEHGMTYDDLAADVTRFLDSHQIDRACLIGHSMGGKLAMHLALCAPHRVSELIVVDIAPISYVVGIHAADSYIAANAMMKVDLPQMQSREEVDRELLRHGVQSRAVRQFVLTNLASAGGDELGKYQWKVNLPAVHAALPNLMSFPDHAGRVYEGPTCLIRGGKSAYVPFQAMKQFTALFPRSKLVTVADAGHWVQAQMPDEFVRAVNDFLGHDKSKTEPEL